MDFWAADDSYKLMDHGWNLSFKGSMATILVERWGTVAGSTGREDSQGRAYIDLMPVAEVVGRAVEMADLLVDKLVEKEWVHAVKPRAATS